MGLLSPPNLRLLAILGVAVLGSYGAWRNHPQAGSTTLTVFMLGLAAIVAAHLGAHVGPGGMYHLFVRVRWLGLVALPFFLLAFALAYTGRESLLTPRGLAAVFAVPAATAVFLFAPEAGGLVGVELWRGTVEAFLDEEGLLFPLVVVVAYAVMIAATLLLVLYSFQVARQFRDVVWVMSAGIAVLWVGTAIELLGLFEDLHVHWLQNAFLVVGLAVLWGVYRRGLTSLTPIARPRVLDSLDVAVLVVDADDRVTDANPAARTLLSWADRELVGRGLDDALADHDDLLAAIRERSDEAVSVGTHDGERMLSPRVTPLTGDGTDGARTVLLYDVTTLHRQREELERQNERLDEFASIVSHDLRNPLSVAQGRLDLVAEGTDDENLEAVADAHARMETLIERVLAFARTGDLVEEPAAVELADVAELSWRTVATDGATVTVATDTTVLADRSYLKQLFENLFRNAVEHGGPNVSVTVGGLPSGFYVADDGPGIPADRRDAVFESGHTTGDGGPGLGLAIVEDIATAHGWSIHVTESEAGGARFEITGVETVD